MPAAGSFYEFGEGDPREDCASFVVELDPHFLQHAVPLAMIVALGEGRRGAFHCGHDLGQGDEFRCTCQHVATPHSTFRMHKARALDSEQDLFEVRLREFGAFRDFFDRRGPVLFV